MENINEVLAMKLRRVARMMHGLGMRRGNYPDAQNRALTVLNMNDGISQRQLAYILAIKPQSSGELLAKMERQGLIVREADENDGRVNLIRLTPAGKERAEALTERKNSDSPVDCLSEEQKENLNEILDTLMEKMKESMPKDQGEDQLERRPHRIPPFGKGAPRPQIRPMPFRQEMEWTDEEPEPEIEEI